MTLTAICYADNHSRMTRLIRLHHKLKETKIARHICAIHDHKGILCVNWMSRPYTSELEAVTDLWTSEGEHESNHYVNGVHLVGDVGGINPFGMELEP